jgi:hypothetical protein
MFSGLGSLLSFISAQRLAYFFKTGGIQELYIIGR